MATVAVTAGLLLTVSGCGGGDDGKDDGKKPAASDQGDGDQKVNEKPSGTDGEVLAEVRGSDSITLTITSAVREEGGFVTVSGKVANGGSKPWVAPGWQGDEAELSKNSASLAGAKLVDKAGKKRYYILRDTEGRCLCTKFSVGVSPGNSKTWYAQFPAPPESTKKVDFQVGDMPSASVELSGE
ncbi:hypothetical protein [Streptomyces iconiensis]